MVPSDGGDGGSGGDAGAAGEGAPEKLDSSGAPASQNFGFYNREGVPSGESYKLTPEEEAARKKRNIAIALSLVGFMVVVFLVTVVQLSNNISNAAG